jgi:KDO2-lipid IV(A) lauroyltransferase
MGIDATDRAAADSLSDKGMITRIRYLFEAGLLHTLFFIFGHMPLDTASACGGWIGRTVGMRLSASRKALEHLRQSLPGRGDSEYRAIIRGMWDNLGRVMAEYPHLKQIGRERVEIVNSTLVENLVRDKKPAIFFTGHLANWEAFVAAAQVKLGLTMDVIYRAPNNPWVDKLLNRVRSQSGDIVTIPKSKTGMRMMLESLRAGRYLGMLVDQKYNEGVPVTFFGRPAMTSPAYVQLAQKFECPLIPGRIERLDGAHFRVTAFEPMKLYDDSGKPRPVTEVLEESHRLLETWITERPEQWLWLHRRWRSGALERQSVESE